MPTKKTASKPFPLTATIFTLISVVILCSLGTWQLQRLNWKNTVISQLQTAYNTPSNTPLTMDKDYAYGQVTGQWLSDKAFLVKPRTQNGKVGAHYIVPLQTKESSILVNLGWTDKDLPSITTPSDQSTSTVTGLSRKPYWSRFTPPNSPQTQEWYRLDIAEIASVYDIKNPAPHILYAEKISNNPFKDFPNSARWYPPNNHAQYTAFWFGMAAILLIIYGLKFFKTKY